MSIDHADLERPDAHPEQHVHDRTEDRAVLESGRRTFMKRMFVGTGATAFAAMGGTALFNGTAAAADPTATPTPSASGTATAPGGGGGGTMTMQTTPTDDFFGLTTDGYRIDDLYAVHSTHVTTTPVREAAVAFLASLTDAQRTETQFGIYDLEWRQWSNVDSYVRNGVDLESLTDAQKKAGLAVLAAGLSAKGLKLTENIRALNDVAGRVLSQTDRFNDELYYFTFMGTPSATEPWGFQFEGHHLVINYFVLGSQVVMTPSFWGSEPTSIVDPDTNVEVRVFDEHFAAALAMVNSLTTSQKATAVVSSTKTGDNNIAEAFKDNVQTGDYVGIAGKNLNKSQKAKLLALANLFIENMDTGHAKVKMAEIKNHLSETYFSWIGATDADAVFYFRIQSPVIYIEFDCELPGPLGGTYGAGQGGGGGTPPSSAPSGTPSAEATPSGTATPIGGTTPSAGTTPTAGTGTTTSVPSRQHVHSVVRTPNGNDYGKELLRQHYLTSPHHRNGR